MNFVIDKLSRAASLGNNPYQVLMTQKLSGTIFSRFVVKSVYSIIKFLALIKLKIFAIRQPKLSSPSSSEAYDLLQKIKIHQILWQQVYINYVYGIHTRIAHKDALLEFHQLSRN